MTTWSNYQQDIFEWHMGAVDTLNMRALQVIAGAGSGKTTTLVEAGKRIMPQLLGEGISIAFNKIIADKLKVEYANTPGMEARTYNSWGFSALVKGVSGKILVDADKSRKILQDNYDRYVFGQYFQAVTRLVSLVKATLTDWTSDADLFDLALEYGIDMNGSAPWVISATKKVMGVSVQKQNWIDFDDQLYLPIYYNMPIKKYAYIQVDEAQDTSIVQQEYINRSLESNTILAIVGDPNQAIYAWRGADITAMQQLAEKFQAETLRLPITYRNCLAVVQLVQQTFPDIQVEAPEWAEQGEVTAMPYNKFLQDVRDNDMILCRNNAPLVKPCYALIRAGKKAIIKGRDIGSGLNSLIDKMKALDLKDLMVRLNDYRSLEVGKLLAANKNIQAQTLEDKCETIEAIADGESDIYTVKDKIARIFSDDAAPITFSTVHRAKGLEADRVHILNPELLLGSRAKRVKEIVGEKNCRYVAYTRARHLLNFVEGN